MKKSKAIREVEYMKEIEKRRESGEESKWEKKRRRILEEADMCVGKEELEKKREEGETEISEKIMERIEEREKEERKRKTEESRYNDIYKKIRTEGLPNYLKGKKSKRGRSRIARYRCGSEVRGGYYWKETERECRICGKGEESLKHVLKECKATKDEISMEEFLSEEGNGLNIMRKIDEPRKPEGQ